MARIDPPPDWHRLAPDSDWKAHPGGVLVIHQRIPIGGENPTKFHSRACRWAGHATFREHVDNGNANSEWFHAPDARSAQRGGAKACHSCGGA